MKKVFAAATVVILSACGGGGGSNNVSSAGNVAGSAPSPAAPAPVVTTTAEPLAAYIGNWASVCKNHAIERASIIRTPGTTDATSTKYKTDYYANADCTGELVASLNFLVDVNTVRLGVVNAMVVLDKANDAVFVQNVDKVRASNSRYVITVSGPGVTRSIMNGISVAAIKFSDGSYEYIDDNGTHDGSTGDEGYSFVLDNVMYMLGPDLGKGMIVQRRYTKQ